MVVNEKIEDIKKLSLEVRDEVAKLVDTGTHMNVARTTRIIAKKLGLNERMVNYTHIELRNKLNEYKFRKVPYNKRMLFLPHCLKNSKECKADITSEGLQCKQCGKCQLSELVTMAKDIGYMGVFITPGGSMAYRLMLKYKPKAIVGVACHNEVNQGVDKADEYNIPAQAILLLRDGCKDTIVNMDEVREKVELIANGREIEHKKQEQIPEKIPKKQQKKAAGSS